MGILWEDEAWQEYIDWQSQDKKTLKKINRQCRSTIFKRIPTVTPNEGNY